MTALYYNCGDRVFQISMPGHGKAHEWQSGKPGSDLVNFHPRMFSLLRTTAIPTSVLVNVSVFYYITGGSYVVFPGGTYNLTPHIPTTPNYVRLVLLGLDTTTNTLATYQGTEAFNSALTPPPLPTGIPSTFIPSALIRVKYNATEISELEISDARVFLALTSTGASPERLYRHKHLL